MTPLLVLFLIPIWYLIDATLWGIAYFAICEKLGHTPTTRVAVLSLMLIFGLGDIVSYFFFKVLDLQIHSMNPEIARVLELQTPVSVVTLFEIAPSDMILWFILAVVSIRIGRRFFVKHGVAAIDSSKPS